VFLEGVPESGAPAADWITADPQLVSTVRLKDGGATDIAIVLDDRDEALASIDFDAAWHRWLHLSNLVGWRTDMSGVAVTTWSRLAGSPTPAKDAGSEHPPLPAAWQALADLATAAEIHFIRMLAESGAPVPGMGMEVGTGIPLSFVWPDHRVAIALELTDEETTTVTASGWTLLDPGSDDLATQVAALTGGA
jgi:hypothetical protein